MTAESLQKKSSKYLPCLLTRLTDEHPFSKDDAGYDSAYAPEQLEHDILVNLVMLLNSHTAPGESIYLRQHYPEVAASGFQYGIDSCTGYVVSGQRPTLIAQTVRRAIEIFEPRLEPGRTQVKVITELSLHDKTAVHLEISSRLAVKPLTQDLYFRLRVDVETGKTTLNS